MIVDAGYLALPIAMVVTAYVAVGSFLGAWQKAPVLVQSARCGLLTVPILLLVSPASLVYAFVGHDFSVKYVAENSNLAMPFEYTWVAFYAGNAGSLLFIALVFSILAVVAVLSLAGRLPFTAPYATALMAMVLTFFLGVIVFLANPLERLSFAPTDGGRSGSSTMADQRTEPFVASSFTTEKRRSQSPPIRRLSWPTTIA